MKERKPCPMISDVDFKPESVYTCVLPDSVPPGGLFNVTLTGSQEALCTHPALQRMLSEEPNLINLFMMAAHTLSSCFLLLTVSHPHAYAHTPA